MFKIVLLMIISSLFNLNTCVNLQETEINSECHLITNPLNHYLVKQMSDETQIAYGTRAGFFEVYDNTMKKKIVVKGFKALNSDDVERAVGEIDAMKSLKDRYDMAVIGGIPSCYYFEKTILIVTQVLDGDVSFFMRGNDQDMRVIGDSMIWRLWVIYSITNSLLDLHNKNFIHLNLKLNHIFNKGGYDIRLGDFSYSMRIPEETHLNLYPTVTSTFVRGIRGYRAPESNTKVYSRKTDIYLLALTIFQALYVTDEETFQKANVDTMLDFINNSCNDENIVNQSLNNQMICRNFKDLLLEMLNEDPLKRPSGDDLRTKVNEQVIFSLHDLVSVKYRLLTASINEETAEEYKPFYAKLAQDCNADFMMRFILNGFKAMWDGTELESSSSYALFHLHRLKPILETLEDKGQSIFGCPPEEFYENIGECEHEFRKYKNFI